MEEKRDYVLAPADNQEPEMFRIEEGVELPEPFIFGREMSADSIRLFNTLSCMRVGDSFVMPKSLITRLGYVSRKAGVKIATRKEGEEHLRVWRTA